MTPLKGRRALVTGASRGVGAAIALAMSKAGAHVVISARNEQGLRKTHDAVLAAGGTVEMYPADLSTRKACRELAAKCGAIDILINNAAWTTGKFDSVLERDDEFWDKNFAVTFWAPLTLMQELGPGMMERKRGVILNISSMAAQRPVPFNAPYNVAKAALDVLSKCAGLELAHMSMPHAVRCNSIALGHVDTEALQENCGPGITPDDVARRNSPLGRAITAQEIADFCVYLSTDAAAPILGTVLTIDGGLTAGSYSYLQSFGKEATAD